jgi:hypothetical protein
MQCWVVHGTAHYKGLLMGLFFMTVGECCSSGGCFSAESGLCTMHMHLQAVLGSALYC